MPPGEDGARLPWLSVVMPSRNGERWIAQALASLCTEPDARGIECILVDGSDTPGTLKIAERYADRLMLRAIRRDDLASWQAKTNEGVALARAEHVCTLHVDDLWLPGRAAAVRRWIAEDSGAALHLGPTVIIDAEGRRLGVWRCPLAEGLVMPDAFLAQLLVQNFVSIPAPVFRRDAFLAVGGLDAALWYTADWDLWLKLGASGGVRYHDTPLTAFRIHGGSLTITGSRSLAEFETQHRLVLDRHLTRLPAMRRDQVRRLAEASVTVNIALAGAMHGAAHLLPRAALQLLRLGPSGLSRYLRDSRLVERVLPRLRAKFAGNL